MSNAAFGSGSGYASSTGAPPLGDRVDLAARRWRLWGQRNGQLPVLGRVAASSQLLDDEHRLVDHVDDRRVVVGGAGAGLAGPAIGGYGGS